VFWTAPVLWPLFGFAGDAQAPDGWRSPKAGATTGAPANAVELLSVQLMLLFSNQIVAQLLSKATDRFDSPLELDN
jgi:hypothetical protein